MRHRHDRESPRPDTWAELDVILPAQLHVPALDDPERRLRLAVLEDAIRDLERYGGAASGYKPRHVDDALAWLRGEDRVQPFSFVNVCEALGWDAETVRAGVLAHCAARATRRLAPRVVARRVRPRPGVSPRRVA